MAISKKNSYLALLIAAFITLIACSTAWYFYNKYQSIKIEYTTLKDNPAIQAEEENTALLEEVNKIIQLPTEEIPNIATVDLETKEKLKDQDFFKNAENGDKILAFVQAKKAILYRPSERKIIEVAPIFIEQDSEALSEDSSTEEEVTEETTTTEEEMVPSE